MGHPNRQKQRQRKKEAKQNERKKEKLLHRRSLHYTQLDLTPYNVVGLLKDPDFSIKYK